jgi:hypothetical protein
MINGRILFKTEDLNDNSREHLLNANKIYYLLFDL